MATVRVPVAGTVGKSVRVNPDATVGAVLGVNLFDENGNVLSIADIAALVQIEQTAETNEFIFEEQIINGTLLARVADDELISGNWAFSATLRLTSNEDVGLATTLHPFQIGSSLGTNLRMDTNEIMAVNNGVASGLNLQADGGDIAVGVNAPAVAQNVLLYLGSGQLRVLDGAGTDYVGFSHDGTDFNITGVNTSRIQFEGAMLSVDINGSGPTDLRVLNGGDLFVYDATNVDYVQLTHSGSNAGISTNAGSLQFSAGSSGDFYQFLAGGNLRVYDSLNTDYVALYHDGTDARINTLNATALRLMHEGVTKVEITSANAYFYNDIRTRAGADLYVYDATNADYISLVETGSQAQILSNANPIYFYPAGAGAGAELLGMTATSLTMLNGNVFQINDATDTDYGRFYHDGTNFYFTNAGTSYWIIQNTQLRLSNAYALWGNDTLGTARALAYVTSGDLATFGGTGIQTVLDSSNYISFRTSGNERVSLSDAVTSFTVWDGYKLRVYDAANTDHADFRHDGTDFNTDFSNTADWNLNTLGRLLMPTTGARVQIGFDGGGASAAIGNTQHTDAAALSYRAYLAYDCYWDDTTDSWKANRTDLGRKFLIDMGYHKNSIDFRFFDGAVALPWADSAWDTLMRIQGGNNLVSFHGTSGIRVYDSTDVDYVYVTHDGSQGFINTVASTGGHLFLGSQGVSTLLLNTNGDVYTYIGNHIINTNNKFYSGRDAGGTVRAFLGINASSNLDLGHSALGQLNVANHVHVNNGNRLRIYDSTGTDYANFAHDGTDFNLSFATTAEMNITGISRVFMQSDLVVQHQVADMNSVDTARHGVSFLHNSFGALNRAGTGNYNAGISVRFTDVNAGAQLVFASDGSNLTPRIYARTDSWTAGVDWQAWHGPIPFPDIAETISAAWTFSAKMTLSDDIQMANLLGDRIAFWNTLDSATGTYAIGMESSTLYFRTGSLFRWYVNTAADGGASDYMQLGASQLEMNVDALVRGGKSLYVYDATNVDYFRISHDGTDANLLASGTTEINITGAPTRLQQLYDDTTQIGYQTQSASGVTMPTTTWGNYAAGTRRFTHNTSTTTPLANYGYLLYHGKRDTLSGYGVTWMEYNANRMWMAQQSVGTSDPSWSEFLVSQPGNYSQFRFYDTGHTDYAQFQHDGTDFNTTFLNTTAWNIDADVVIGGTAALGNQRALTIVENGGQQAGLAVEGNSATSTLIDLDNYNTAANGVQIRFLMAGVQKGTIGFNPAASATAHVGIQNSHNGTQYHSFFVEGSGYYLKAGGSLRIYDSTNADYFSVSHDGVDANIVGVGTTDINATSGITAWNFPAITLVTALDETYGGTGLTSFATGDIMYASAANTLAKLAAGTNGHVLTLAAGVPTWAAPSSGPATEVKYKTADESVTSSTTLQNDDHLAGFTVAAATYYKVTGFFFVDFASATPDIKFQWSFSQTPQATFSHASAASSASASNGDAGEMTGVVSINANLDFYGISYSGFILGHATTAGTATLQWAQVTSSGSSVTMKKGSWIKFEQIS